MCGHHHRRFHHREAGCLGLSFLLTRNPQSRQFEGGLHCINTHQAGVGIGIEHQVIAHHYLAAGHLNAIDFKDIFAGPQIDIVPQADRRNDDTQFQGDAFADGRYAV